MTAPLPLIVSGTDTSLPLEFIVIYTTKRILI